MLLLQDLAAKRHTVREGGTSSVPVVVEGERRRLMHRFVRLDPVARLVVLPTLGRLPGQVAQ